MEVAEAAAELVLDAEEVGVMVTLKTVGTTVVVVMSRLFEWMVVVTVVELVVRDSETDVGVAVPFVDCPRAGAARRRTWYKTWFAAKDGAHGGCCF